MPKKLDLTGRTFGRLTVISEAPRNKHKQSCWHCLCSCGNKTIVPGFCLTRGDTKSCGCLRHVPYSQTHGETKTKLFKIWAGMKTRCYCKGRKDFKHYGARGISVCDEWRQNFEAFRDWAISTGYAEGLSIDRIDVNGNYCPENCRWVTLAEQKRNRRNTIQYQGKTIAEWARLLGISYSTLHSRIAKCGWSFEKAISTPSQH